MIVSMFIIFKVFIIDIMAFEKIKKIKDFPKESM